MEKKTPYNANNQTELPLKHYLSLFAEADPEEIAERLGIKKEGNELFLKILGEEIRVDWPEFKNEAVPDKNKILFLHYLLEGKKAGSFREFLAYNELPWGDVYDRNFRGRCIFRLIRDFGTKPERLETASEKLGGNKIRSSGTGYDFCFTDNFYIRMIIWEGDEEFPASGQIIFSENFPDGFAAEDRVVVCEYLLKKLESVL